jgi:hypothetical protein
MKWKGRMEKELQHQMKFQVSRHDIQRIGNEMIPDNKQGIPSL